MKTEKFNIGDKFNYTNHSGTYSEPVEIVGMRGEEFVFDSNFTPGMTLPELKIEDMLEKGKLIKQS